MFIQYLFRLYTLPPVMRMIISSLNKKLKVAQFRADAEIENRNGMIALAICAPIFFILVAIVFYVFHKLNLTF